MKYLLTLFFILGINFSVLADDQDTEHTHENDYEEGCDNELDDDMDGDVDANDSDCEVVAAFWGDSSDYSGYLVWGVGIALLNGIGSDSGTGTATTD